MPLHGYTTLIGDLHGRNGTPVRFKKGAGTPADLTSGELVAFTNGALVRFVRDGSAGNLCGITREASGGRDDVIPVGIAMPEHDQLSCFTTGVHELRSLDGETFSHGAEVFMSGTSTDTVTLLEDGAVTVGRVHLPDGREITGPDRVPVVIDGYTR